MENILLPSKKAGNATSYWQNVLLYSGIISILWYVAINILIPLQDAGYSIASQTVSELSAIGAPTRSLWVIMCIPFSLLTIAFGFGVWSSGRDNKKLRVVAGIIIFDALVGLFWPPMNQRQIIAAGGGTISDTLHLAWAFLHLFCMLLMIGFAAAALGRDFRIFSIATILVFLVFGILTSIQSKGISAGTPTPYIGVWERINIGAYMLWVAVFAITLLKKAK